jgi:hypothetical protein
MPALGCGRIACPPLLTHATQQGTEGEERGRAEEKHGLSHRHKAAVVVTCAHQVTRRNVDNDDQHSGAGGGRKDDPAVD